jgi:hypothetical protein
VIGGNLNFQITQSFGIMNEDVHHELASWQISGLRKSDSFSETIIIRHDTEIKREND